MNLLQKYHKQRMSKKTLAQLEKMKKTYQLKYPDNLKYTFKLLLVQNSIQQKDAFEQSFEAFRNRHLDMWDNISFNERNKLFQMDFEDIRVNLHHFMYGEERIYIPVFDILFNNLYDRETAILELPQYFKLQSQFKDEMIDVVKYGILPYQSGFTYPCLAKRENSAIVFDESINTFYRINDQVVFYPLLAKAQITAEHAQTLANLLNDFDDAGFLQFAMDHGYCHSKLIKKVEKQRR